MPESRNASARELAALVNVLLAPFIFAAGVDGNPGMVTSANASGIAQTLSTNGAIDPENAFFQSLGTNGRACVSCHQPKDAWSITPTELQKRFAESDGLDPIFRTNDGSNSPLADTSTVYKRRSAYSMLLRKGVIRVGLPLPAGAEFELATVDDPYGFASSSEFSLFRRPLPAANLRFLSGVMWDSRENIKPIQTPDDLMSNLEHQSVNATLGHAQAAAPPTPQQVKEIVEFETGLYTAQVRDNYAGWLSARGANGGALALSTQPFFIGINDPLGGNPSGEAFNAEAMTLFTKWNGLSGTSADPSDFGDTDDRNDARESVARGEQIFNTRVIAITGVSGLNDALNVPVLQGTCTTCHDAPNAGNHSVPLAINIGISDASRRTPDLPLYSLRNRVTGETIQTTDPGRALITGKWADIGKFKGPVLRALAARPPYFHNGSAATLSDVLDFYHERFGISFTDRERKDLIAFLRSL
jgi:cytochrome c peroxidase